LDFDNAMRVLLGDFHGFNVTIPYKRDILEYLDEVDDCALSCGTVNTVVSATRTGYNTDGAGFSLMLSSAGITVKNKKILILGIGGAGRSVAVALKKMGAQVYAYRRDRNELLEACEQLGLFPVFDPETGGFEMIINCTGVGMHDTIGVSPIGERAFRGAEWAVDLIYRPKESEFLRIAKAQNLKTLNGEAMLFYQAYYADCLYLDRLASEMEAQNFYNEYIKESESWS
jgi:shikimate dehydrogenase